MTGLQVAAYLAVGVILAFVFIAKLYDEITVGELFVMLCLSAFWAPLIAMTLFCGLFTYVTEDLASKRIWSRKK